ncbi:MAG: carbohydrate kinase [Anaerolineales bacterium]|nr:carbohydrate kinase [Anaerolineales bacterium]
MPTPSLLLGIDQGSSGSRALLLDLDGHVRGYGYRPLARLYPRPGWVEQDPHAVTQGVAEAITEAIGQAECQPADIAACGIASQRNTEFIWDTHTLRPYSTAITWQDLRTEPMVAEEINHWATPSEYRTRLGFFPGPYSTALHLAWRMRHDPEFARLACDGKLHTGFSAEWLVMSLGRATGHFMDTSLVQAGGLYDFRAGDYWQEWLDFLNVPRALLPAPRPTLAEYGVIGVISPSGVRAEIPVRAMIGDQQGALFGYDCRTPGDAECTHGTASFVNVCIGETPSQQTNLNVYHAWEITRPNFCLEADTTVTGAALRWMREHARFLDDETEVGPLAATVPDTGGVMFVPAFTGLNVPHHDRAARATLVGMTLSTTRAHIARAFLASIGFQIRAILDTIREDTGLSVQKLHVGGGLSASDEACQIQADLTGLPIIRPEFAQTTARAAALLAGLGAGVFARERDLPPLPGGRRVFEPGISAEAREEAFGEWQKAIRLVREWGAV